jgi:hypothetical protein
MDKPKEFYRYEAVRYASCEYESYLKVELITYNLHKETPKGYWIGASWVTYPKGHKLNYRSHLRWVSKDSKKRHAYPTKEEALTGFIARTKRRANILTSQLSDCKGALTIAKNIQETLTTVKHG